MKDPEVTTLEPGDQSLVAQLAQDMAHEEQAAATAKVAPAKAAKAKTPKAPAERRGGKAEPAPVDETAEDEAEPAEEVDLSQAAIKTAEEEEGAAAAAEGEEPAEVEAEAETPEGGEEPAAPGTKAPRLADVLDTIPDLKPEQKEAIGDCMHRVVADRLAKITDARKKEAETALAEERTARETAEARVQELEATSRPQVQLTDNPLAQATPQELAEKEKSARQALGLYEEALDGLLDNPRVIEKQFRAAGIQLTNAEGEEDYSPDRMRAWLNRNVRRARQDLDEHIPQRRDVLQQRVALERQAVTLFPVLKDPKSPFTQQVDKLLKETFPELSQVPYGRLLVSHLVRDVATNMKKAPAAKAPLAAAPLPKVKAALPSAAAGKPAATPGAKSAALIAAQKKFDESGSGKDLTALLAAGG